MYNKLSLHDFTEKEYNRNEKFRKKHYKKCGNAGTYIYTLTAAGIGELVKVKCPICGKEKDITDTDNW